MVEAVSFVKILFLLMVVGLVAVVFVKILFLVQDVWYYNFCKQFDFVLGCCGSSLPCDVND